MKVLFLSAANNIHTVRWVNALVDRGVQVDLVYCTDHRPSINKINKQVRLYELPFGGELGYYLNIPKLKAIYHKSQPDIVNCHYASGYGTLARLSRVRPLLLSVWGSDVYDFPYKSRLHMKIIRDNLLYATKIASTSKAMAKQVKAIVPEYSKPIAITPFGVDLSKYSLSPGEKHRGITIGNIKTLKPKYGISDLVNSINLLKNMMSPNDPITFNELRVVIYGDGPLRDDISHLVKSLHLEKTIKLMGHIKNESVPRALKRMDIFCLTSVLNSESFGVSAIEAMATGLPVVATDTDGFTEIIPSPKYGLIVKKGDIQAIARELYVLIQSPDLRHKIGKKGRKRIERLYDWDQNVNQMLRVYNNVISEK